MKAKHSAILQNGSNKSTYFCPFGTQSNKFRLEITEAGILLCPAIAPSSEDSGSGTSKSMLGYSTGGMLIKASTAMKVTCQLPFCTVLQIPLLDLDRAYWDVSLEKSTPSTSGQQPGNTGKDRAEAMKQKKYLHKSAPWLWLGDSDTLMNGFNRLVSLLAFNQDHMLYISIASTDRTQRDCVCMCARYLCNPSYNGLTMEQRISKLPWRHGVDGSGSLGTVGVDTIDVYNGLDTQLLNRNKYLETEILKLKKLRNEMAVQSVNNNNNNNNQLVMGINTPGVDWNTEEDKIESAEVTVTAPSSTAGVCNHSNNILTTELLRLQEENDQLLTRIHEMENEHLQSMQSIKNRVEELQYESMSKDISVELLKQQWNGLSTEFESLKQQSEIDKQLAQQKYRQLQAQQQQDCLDKVGVHMY